MNIDKSQFCALSSSPRFLSWLKSTDGALYNDLDAHLKKALGCGANRDKMEAIYDKLIAGGYSKKLFDFIYKNYPSLIIDDYNKHRVFQHYDPSLLTYPRRYIIINSNRLVLDRMVTDFCARHGYSEFVVIEDRAYIEYIDHNSLKIKDRIPDRNWQVRQFKRIHKIS